MRIPTIVGLATAVLASLVAVAPAASQRPEVVELRFEGAESFTRAELASAIATSRTRCRNPVYELLLLCWAGIGEEEAFLTPGALETDAFRLKVYYYERGFREAEVTPDTARAGDAVKVTFRIREGRPVRVARIDIEGAPRSLSTKELPISNDAPFDVVSYEAARDTLLTRLRNSGFARAQVLVGYMIDRDEPHAAVIRYDVFPGPAMRFGAIRVEGAREASSELVRRRLTFREGDPYDRSALLLSQRNLYELQIFRHAVVEADPDAGAVAGVGAGANVVSDSLIPIRVRVAEGDMRRVRAGAGANTVECGTLEGRWTSRNFMGNGRRFSVSGRLGNLLIDQCDLLVDDRYTAYDRLTGILALDFTEPWFLGPRNDLGMGLYAERRNVPEVFVRTAAGGYVSVGRSIGGDAVLSLGYRPELTELSTHQGGDLFFCVNFVGCTFEDVAVLRDPHLLSPATLSFTLDRTDALFSPSSGFTLHADLEHAGAYTLSDFAYTRFLGEGSAYLGEPGGLIIATRIRAGVGWAHPGGAGSSTLGLNPQKRFFAGGPNSVRGFDQYRLGPTVLGIDAVPFLVREDDPTTPEVEGAGCSPQEVNDLTCDVTLLARDQPGIFEERPSGGEVLLEGNVELRFPLPLLGGNLRGAAFVDAGQVWRARSDVALDGIVATPGIGLRYYSPIGPIRVDAAFNPRGPQALQVLTTRVTPCLRDELGCESVDGRPTATLRNTDNVAPLRRAVAFGSELSDMESMGDFFRRFNLQFSIGQAF